MCTVIHYISNKSRHVCKNMLNHIYVMQGKQYVQLYSNNVYAKLELDECTLAISYLLRSGVFYPSNFIWFIFYCILSLYLILVFLF